MGGDPGLVCPTCSVSIWESEDKNKDIVPGFYLQFLRLALNLTVEVHDSDTILQCLVRLLVGKATAEKIDLSPAHRPQLLSPVGLQLLVSLDRLARRINHDQAMPVDWANHPHCA